MLLVEFTVGLLRHLNRLEYLIVDELHLGKDWLVLRICLERDILACHQGDHHWIQLFAKEA